MNYDVLNSNDKKSEKVVESHFDNQKMRGLSTLF